MVNTFRDFRFILFRSGFYGFFIIAFDVYWLLKTIYLSLHLRSAFKKIKENLKINWLEKLTANYKLQTINKNWRDIYHLIILPFYNESEETIRASVKSLIPVNYPKDKIIVVLAAEERAGESILEITQKIKKNSVLNFSNS